MKVVETNLRELPSLPGKWVITLGTFDGVHRGHAAICREAVSLSRRNGLSGSIALTFARHPRAVLSPRHYPRLLTTLSERIPLLAASGLDHLYVLDFDEELRELDYRDFVREILMDRLGLAELVLGHDVHFGKARGGTADAVSRLAADGSFVFRQVQSVQDEGKPVSSTWIRDLLEQGLLEKACSLLGHPYFVWGEVVRGRGDGHRLGFPTANLELPDAAKLLPPKGVYAAWARAAGEDRWLEAVLNLGHAPTLGSSGPLRLEVHLLEGGKELYGRLLEVVFGARIRAERRFSGPKELVARIRQDAAEAPGLLAGLAGERRPEALSHPG